MESNEPKGQPINQPEPIVEPTKLAAPSQPELSTAPLAPIVSTVEVSPSAPTLPAVSVIQPTVVPVTPVAPVASFVAQDFVPPVAPITPPENPGNTFAMNKTAVVGGDFGSTSYNVTDSGLHSITGGGKKKFFLAGGVAVAVLLLSGGWVFGMYLPSKPENVWKTGLDRTGKAVDSIVQNATDLKKLDLLKTSELSGDLTVKSDSLNMNGDFTAKLDDTNSNSSLNLTLKQQGGASDLKLSAKVLTQLDKSAQYPNTYFQINGITALGLDAFVPKISTYDGKWIEVNGDYLKKSIGQSGGSADNPKNQITSKDVAEAVRVVSAATKDYVLTSDASKAVLLNKGFVAKETVDGLKAYHYTATLDKTHAKAYCQALGTNVATTNVFKKLVDEKDRNTQKDSLIKSCQDSADKIKSTDTFDLWIDSHYKLIHKVRVYNSTGNKTYADFGQNYKGDDNLNLFLKVHNPTQKMDFNLTSTTNSKTFASSGTLSFTSGDKTNALSVKANYKVKSAGGSAQVTKPTVTIKIEDLLQQLGIPTSDTSLLPTQSL
jgi:hypothetical protein